MTNFAQHLDAVNEPWAVRVSGVVKRHEMVSRSGTRAGAFLWGRVQERRNQRAFHAVDDVSFEIRRGELCALIGHNGAGKSTLLRAIAGITPVDSGSIQVNGRVGAMLELGFGFEPDLTGYENCFLQGALVGVDRAEIRALLPEISAFAAIGEAMERPVRHYSAGMFARLAFSLATSLRPDVLLVDEILSVGDPDFQAISLRRILELRDQGVAIVAVSHVITMLREIADHAVWMERGRVRMDDSARSVIDAYILDGNLARLDAGANPMSQFIRPEMVEDLSARLGGGDGASNGEPGEAEIVGLRFDREPNVYVPHEDISLEIDYRARAIDSARLICRLLDREGALVTRLVGPPIPSERLNGATQTTRVTLPDCPLGRGLFEARVALQAEGADGVWTTLNERAGALEIRVSGPVRETACFPKARWRMETVSGAVRESSDTE